MTSPRPPQLILTGGTLSASRDEAGLLVPSASSLDQAIRNAGLDPSTAVRPYTIDSIDFDIGEHYPALRDAAIEALKAGRTPVICGGTDTLAWYSTLLTDDLMRRGYLHEGSGESVIFLSAMKSIEEAPQHITNVLAAGRRMAEQGLSGGFAVCAERAEAVQFVVHDVTNHFDKISGELTNAFRSRCPVGYLIDGQFHPSPYYSRPPSPSHVSSDTFSRIAPPLLNYQDNEIMLTYLQEMAKARPPVDGVIIEGHPADDRAVEETCRALTSQGMRVIFCNPIRYNNRRTPGMKPVISPELWAQNSDPLIRRLTAAGAEFTTALPKEAYLDALLDTPRRNAQDSSTFPARHRQERLGIRYVPNIAVMHEAIDSLAPHAEVMKFSALPHKVIPDSLRPTMKKNRRTTRFQSVFEYDNTEYIGESGEPRLEGAAPNPYKAGQAAGTLIESGKKTDRNR